MELERLDNVKALKQRATALRNAKQFPQALRLFDQAIGELESLRASGLSKEPAVLGELADTHGMKGGTYRRSDQLDLALNSYREGLTIERDCGSSTYNASNVILLSITREKRWPLDAGLKEDLDRVITALENDTAGARADEWWAWSDLAQFYLLRNEMPKARAAYQRALRTGPTSQELNRHVTLLWELGQVAPDLKERVEAVVVELGRR